MKILIMCVFPLILSAISPFESPNINSFDLSVFDTKRTNENNKAIKNEEIICREVCDKKLYKEQKIADAISFYKRTIIKP